MVDEMALDRHDDHTGPILLADDPGDRVRFKVYISMTLGKAVAAPAVPVESTTQQTASPTIAASVRKLDMGGASANRGSSISGR